MVELGIIDEALKCFNEGIAVEPDYDTIYHNKGWLLNNIGRYTEAVSCFNKALELSPLRAVTYDNLADALFNLGDYQGSLAAYHKVLKLLKPGLSPGIRALIRKRIKQVQRHSIICGGE
jgi:tetratricopeptide (TPR) repeat protein